MDGPDNFTDLAPRHARVVVVRALRLGDLLCAVPALRALRAALPRAEITLIGLPLAREFVRRCRYVDRFEEFPGYPGIANQDVQPARRVAFLARMQAYGFDLSVQLHGSGVFSNPFTRLLGAQRMVGLGRAGPDRTGCSPFCRRRGRAGG
jgi:ADP-heptose:LPS heptosyltransferase